MSENLSRFFDVGMFDQSPAVEDMLAQWESDIQHLRDMHGDVLVDMAIETVIAMWARGRLKTLSSPNRLMMQIIQRREWSLKTNDPPSEYSEHEDGALMRGRKL